MINLFFSYAHRDEAFRDELEIHLAMLKRQGLVRAWHDRRIVAGDDVHGEISEHLEQADVILLLVSPYLLASDYCYDVELQRALERHVSGEARLIPVILEPCDWLNAPFKSLRATPKDGKPVSKFPNIHDAFLEVTGDIRAAAEQLGKSTSADVPAPDMEATAAPARGARSSNLRVRRTFSDRERDTFVDEVFEYVATYFENSLEELAERNAAVEQRFKLISKDEFTASIYSVGEKKSSCRIWLPGQDAFGGDIAYAIGDSGRGQSMNDSMRVEDDGYTLGMKPLAMARPYREEQGLAHAAGCRGVLLVHLGVPASVGGKRDREAVLLPALRDVARDPGARAGRG